MDYKELLDDVLELDEKFVIVIGCADIVTSEQLASNLGLVPTERLFNNLTSDNFWRVIGRGDDEHIIEALTEFGIDSIDCDGEYEFKAVLKWSPSEYDDYGRLTMRSYLEVEYIEFKFIQTFQQREREIKLDTLLDFDNLFE